MLNTHDAPKNDMQATVYIDSLFVEVSSALIVQYYCTFMSQKYHCYCFSQTTNTSVDN